jgi:hypothetical protein
MQSTYAKQAQPYLTESGLRVVVTDKNPSNLSKALPSAQLNQLVETASKQICKTVVGDYRQIISSLAEQAEALAASEMGAIIDESVAQCQERANLEVLRIKQLQQRNEAITDADVKALEQGYNNVKTAMLTSCKPIISAIRLLVTYKPDS